MRKSIFGFALGLTSFLLTVAATGASASVVFRDDFDGATLGNAWVADANGGSLLVQGGAVTLSSSAVRFPYVRNVQTLVPAGDFVLTFRMKYNSAEARGTGFRWLVGTPPNGAGECAGSVPSFSVWQDLLPQHARFQSALTDFCSEIRVPFASGVDLDWHIYQFTRMGSAYSFRRDDLLVWSGTAPAGSAPVFDVGFGNWTVQGSAGPWSSLSLDYVDVSTPDYPSVSEPSFIVELVAQSLPVIDGDIEVAPASFGAWGGHLFIAGGSEDHVLRIAPAIGAWSVFGTAPTDPNGMVFGSGGTFGSDLYVSCNQNSTWPYNMGSIWRFSSSGGRTYFGTQTPPDYLYGAVDLAVSLAGDFGEYLYTGTSGGYPGDCISRMPPAGNPTSLFHTIPGGPSGYLGTPTGVAFAPGGTSPFGGDLFFGLTNSGDPGLPAGVYRLDATGARTALATSQTSTLITAVRDVEFGSGSAFGSDLYVADGAGRILRIDAIGQVSEFVTGIPGNVKIAFDGDRALYFSDGVSRRIYRVVPSAMTPPFAPSNLTATLLYPPQAQLTWQDNSDDETGFEIQQEDDASEVWTTVAEAPPDATTWTSDLLGDGTHTYRVRSCRDDDCSPWSNTSRVLIGETRLRVLAQVWRDYEGDGYGSPYLDPPPPMGGVEVDLRRGGVAIATAWTDASGVATFPLVTMPGDSFRLKLRGPNYEIRNTEEMWQAPVLATRDITAASSGFTEYVWPNDKGIQVTYFMERFRKEYWRDRLDFEWTLGSELGTGSMRADCYPPTALVGDASAGGTFISCKDSFCLQSDNIFHELTHNFVHDRIYFYVQQVRPSGLSSVAWDEGASMSEALADYFAASFNADPVIDYWREPRDLSVLMRYPSDPLSVYRYEPHEGSVILSGALWELRGIIDGPTAPAAPMTDKLVWAALDSMLSNDPSPTAVYGFQDYYFFLQAADQALFDGQHAPAIGEVFDRRYLGPSSVVYSVLEWQGDDGITSVEEPSLDEILLSWKPLDDAYSYNVLVNISEYGEIGGFVTLATGITDTTFLITGREPRTEYLLSVTAVDSTGQNGYMAEPVFLPASDQTGVWDENPEGGNRPYGRLLRTYPNPVRGRVQLVIDVLRPGWVSVEVYDITGRLIRSYGKTWYPVGEHDVTWDTRDEAQRAVVPGVYLIRITGGDWHASGKVVIVR